VDFRAFSWPQYLGLGSWFRSESDRNSPPMTRMSADGDPAFATPFDTAQALTERGTRTHKRLSWIGSPSRHPQIRFNPRDPIRLRSGLSLSNGCGKWLGYSFRAFRASSWQSRFVSMSRSPTSQKKVATNATSDPVNRMPGTIARALLSHGELPASGPNSAIPAIRRHSGVRTYK
jgi:hypothetical protein